MNKQRILQLLEESRGAYISGEEIAKELHLSRAAIWKHIQVLQSEGIQIISQHGLGYSLPMDENSLTDISIQKHLRTKEIGRKLTILDTIASTNTYIKQHEEMPHGWTVVAKEQSAGRGRLGRTFLSPAGGIYMSILLKPQLPIQKFQLITFIAAVSVCMAIENLCHLQPKIKWVNDIFMNQKKICGILTEASIEGESGNIESVIVGIGLNLKFPAGNIPEEITNIATSIEHCTTYVPRRSICISEILNIFEALYQKYLSAKTETLLEAYRARMLPNKEIKVCTPQETYPATIIDLTEDGHLLVQKQNGTTCILSSGEISISFSV